jgi:serine/threonine protein kinase
MELERWRQVEELYHGALKLEPRQRSRFLQESCPGDAGLLAEVESLLAYETSAEEFIEGTALDVAARLMARDQQRADPPMSGRTISSFHVLKKLGQGGMGVVYEAEDTKLGRRVALKFLPGTAASDGQALERFRREARTASALNHPNICTIYSVQDFEGQPFIEMERLFGRTLRERIGGKPLDVDTVLALANQIADGLEAAHAKGVVHRDLKPGNVFATEGGLAKILDFGMAKLGSAPQTEGQDTGAEPVTACSEALTNPGALMGTAAYMSPEQVLGLNVDSRTDLFSFGALLYEMATGRPAFAGPSSTAILDAILKRTPVSARQLNPEIPAALDGIVTKALEKDLALRYQTASELGADLKRLKRDRDSRKRRWPLVAAAVLILGLVARAALWYSQSQAAPFLETSVRQLTHNSSEDSVDSGAISPDGKYLAYSDRKGLHIRANETGETRTLPQPDGLGKARAIWDLAPGWLPDGTRFVANLRSDDTVTARASSVWMVSLQGALRKLRDDAGAFSVSPDGAWIAFGKNGSDLGDPLGDREVWRMASNGERAQKLYEAEGKGLMTNVVWSPDGRRTAYLKADESGAFVVIETRDLDGGAASQILRVSETGALEGFVWLRDGRLLYSVGERDTPTRAGTPACTHWQVRVDALTGRPLEEPKRFASWLPQCVGPMTVTADLKHAAFRQWAIQDVIYTADLEPNGTGIATPRRLTFNEGRNIPSGFAPDGKTVVFVSDGSGSGMLLLRQSLDADTPEIVARGPRISGGARLSPDGSWVFYVLDLSGTGFTATNRLMKVSLMGGRAQEVLTGNFVGGGARCAKAPATLCAIAEGSSDGRQLVFTAFDLEKGRGRELVRFDSDPDGDYKWDLSPDGLRLAVLNAKGARVHVLSLAGGAPSELDVKGWNSLGYVSWTADGQGLIVPSQDKRGAALLSVDLQGAAHVLWEQEGSTATSGIPSPDGRRIAIWVRGHKGNIWMADTP